MNDKKMMSPQELEQTSSEYKIAIQKGNYNEILRLNQKIYESEYISYKLLLEYRKLWEKKKSDIISRFGEPDYFAEIEKIDLRLKYILKGLENLAEASHYIGNLLFDEGGQTQ